MTRIEEERVDDRSVQSAICQALLDAFPMADKIADNYAAVAVKAIKGLELKELRAQGGVSVRPLQWEQTDPHFPWAAQSLIGRYTAWDFDGKDGHWMRPGDVAGVRVKGGLEEAKAAAEQDYRTRVLSALETEAVEPVAWKHKLTTIIRYDRPNSYDLAQGDYIPLYAHPPLSSIPTVTGEMWVCRDFTADPCGSAKCASCGKRRHEHLNLSPESKP